MAYTLWSQDKFTKGELSPLLYARASVTAYYDGLKTAQNILTFPQGAAGKRFGTEFWNELNSSVTNYEQIYFKTFQYKNECVYLVVIRPDNIDIYLEKQLVATVSSTGLDAEDIRRIDHTVLGTDFRIATGRQAPKDLQRIANAANAITSFTASTLTITSAITNGIILPARFTGATLPASTPTLRANRTYFIKATTTTTIEVYSTIEDALNSENAYAFTSSGTTANLLTLNNWSLNTVSFKNYPVYDFGGTDYSGFTFTLGATSGNNISLTSSSAVFTTDHVGGAFFAPGGIARIITFNSSTSVQVTILQTFTRTANSGKFCLVAEKAWSDTRGWPRKCSSFQSRSFFANTDSINNGLWGSAINAYNDFDDLFRDDDDAISWYPTSDEINYIQFIVPYRSLTIHTNSGVYSSPLSFETAITPNNFSVTLQDATPAENIQPSGIDNQILVVSGNDVHSMLWNGDNNAYNSDIISIASEQLIRNPVDEAAYADLNRAGSRYLFITNEDGSMATYQTLIAQEVSGWTPQRLYQSYGNGYFRWATSNFDGRAWFVTEREIAEAASAVTISSVSTTEVTATGVNFDTSTYTACKFTTTGALPASSPQIAEDTYYWAVGIDANTFYVYLTIEDAINDDNAIVFSNTGSGTNQVEPWPLSTKFFIEELDFDLKVDCASYYDGSATSTLTGLSRFNAQAVKIQGDGYGFEAIGEGDEVEIEAHGESVDVTSAQVGLPIKVQMVPMPLSIAMGNSNKMTNLVQPKHIRDITFMFNETVGGTVNGVPIAINAFNEVMPGSPPAPASGLFRQSVMKGWDDFNNQLFVIEHDEPFDIRLLGLFYKVEI